MKPSAIKLVNFRPVAQFLNNLGHLVHPYLKWSLFKIVNLRQEYAVVQLVEALRYKSEVREFDSRWGYLEIFVDIIQGLTA